MIGKTDRTDTFDTLNAPYRSLPAGRDAVCSDILPGKSLWDHLKENTLTPHMLEAAGVELRRAHALWSADTTKVTGRTATSPANILYDPVSDSARLIDSSRNRLHHHFLSAIQRHAEDLCCLCSWI